MINFEHDSSRDELKKKRKDLFQLDFKMSSILH